MEINISAEELAKRSLFVGTPMYGGQCTGQFTRSIADLSAICTHYKIKLQYYFLFNESLITRARNYVCDSFMRSECSHMLFLDADIGFNPQDVIAMLALQGDDSEYDVLTAPYPKKCICLPSTSVITTEDGPQTMKQIVDTQYSGKVLSFRDGSFVWNKIKASWKKDRNGKKWVKVVNDKRHNLICTFDHQVLSTENIIKQNNFNYIEAKDLTGKFVIRNLNAATKLENPLFNDDQMSVLLGILMGDGCIRKDKVFSTKHSYMQKDYIEYIQNILGGKIIKTKGGYIGNDSYYLWCPTNGQTRYLRDIVYPNGIKTVKNVLSYIDEKALAFWYLDDGHYIKPRRLEDKPRKNYSYGDVRLFTNGFSREDVELIQTFLKEKWNIDSYIYETVHRADIENIEDFKPECFIHIPSKSVETFFNLITPYVPKCMEEYYDDKRGKNIVKLPEMYRNQEKYNFDNKHLNYAASYVKKVEEIPEGHAYGRSMLYDLEVENDHNFMANGTVVHNCWEKVKLAVEKGFGDEDPNNLEKFVGDYVINPKAGQNEVRLDMPVEVLEAGTGFMMIRRNTFARFQEAFPQYYYKPDHVRTAEFDGSRDIMQFFQAEIDPKSRRYLSEDYWFSQKLQEIGMKVFLCPWMRTQHQGSYVFGGSIIDLAQLGVSATCDESMLRKKPIQPVQIQAPVTSARNQRRIDKKTKKSA